MHPQLLAVLTARNVNPANVHTYHSDILVGCATHSEALALVDAGPWRSMASACRMNPEHPDAKLTPWIADIPLARLSGLIAERLKEVQS